jgi:hypothetical protein
MTTTIEQRCGGTNKRAQPCGMTVNLRRTRNGLRCIQHDPQRVREARRMQSQGGKATMRKLKGTDPSKVPPVPKTAGDAVAYAAWITDQLARGSLDPKRGDAMTKALAQFTRALDRRELEDRVRGLEALVRRSKRAKAGHDT